MLCAAKVRNPPLSGPASVRLSARWMTDRFLGFAAAAVPHYRQLASRPLRSVHFIFTSSHRTSFRQLCFPHSDPGHFQRCISVCGGGDEAAIVAEKGALDAGGFLQCRAGQSGP